MKTKTKKETTPDMAFAWLVQSQKRKWELQEKFQKDCDSGKVDELIRNGKPVNR